MILAPRTTGWSAWHSGCRSFGPLFLLYRVPSGIDAAAANMPIAEWFALSTGSRGSRNIFRHGVKSINFLRAGRTRASPRKLEAKMASPTAPAIGRCLLTSAAAQSGSPSTIHANTSTRSTAAFTSCDQLPDCPRLSQHAGVRCLHQDSL